MPKATTPYSTIKSYCQDEVMDTSDEFWDATAWQREINRVTKKILDEIMYYKAFSPLADSILEDTDITGDGTGSYDWHNAVTTDDSKTFYCFVKLTVNDSEFELDEIRYINWSNAKNGFIVTSARLGLFTFVKDGSLETVPDFESTDTLHFWYLQIPTDMTGDTHTPNVEESLIEMYALGTAQPYWRARGRESEYAMAVAEWERQVRKKIKPFAASKIRRFKSTKSY